jgi:hypothetical protein
MNVINDVILWLGEQPWFTTFVSVALTQWLASFVKGIKGKPKLWIVGIVAFIVQFIVWLLQKRLIY